MSREDEIKHLIDKSLDCLHQLSENCAKEPNEWLAIHDAEMAIHDVRTAFEQELDKE